jgi:serine/threonine-protein kinase
MEGVEKFFAIKLLLPQYAEEQSVVDMFITEARIAARIAHPNVCQVFELGIEDDELFICMEFLRGIPINAILKAHKPLNPIRTDIAVAIVQQACAGLHFAHELKDESGENLGVVHRDISPGNIFLTAEGTAKVLDFGVVKANDTSSKTRTGVLKGKFGYMSPEQIMAKPVDRRSDVFSLGIVLFELLTNRRLFARESEYATLKAITESPITRLSTLRPDLPEGLCDVVNQALTRDLDQRFANMKEFSQALGMVMKSQGGVADATEIADYVQGKFVYQLGEVDRMLQEAALSEPADPLAPQRGDPTGKTRSIASEEVGRAKDTEGVAPLAYAEGKRPRNSMLIVALVIVGLAMSALAVAILLKSDSGGQQQTVLVQGAGLMPDIDASDGPTADPASVLDAGAIESGGGLDGGDSTKPPIKRDGCAGKGTPSARNKCYVRAGSAGLKSCIKKHSATAAGTKQLVLVFDLDKRGKIKNVGVAPAAVASSPLGACAKKAAQKIRFGPQGDNIRFSIPLRISQR